jgi:lipopolysaccharide transport system permease protein
LHVFPPNKRSEQSRLTQGAIVIEAGRRERAYWLDLWRYRELFRVLAGLDLSVRYKQTVIGVLWALIRPFLAMLVFTIIFGQIAPAVRWNRTPTP